MSINTGKLKILQNLGLDEKILLTNRRIKEWYEHHDGHVYVSFSGGKDSTVLLDMVRKLYPEVPAVFFNTGLEFPEIIEFVRRTENVEEIRPKMTFVQVLNKYGYPVVSKEQSQYISEIRNTKSDKLKNIRLNGQDNKYKSGKISEKWKYLIDAPFKISHKCCNVMKKNPNKQFMKESNLFGYVGIMAEDSKLRNQMYKRSGCNAFYDKFPQSRPMMTWKEKDVWEYIKRFNVPYSSIYDMGYKRTGCIFCMFGVHLEKEPNRFQRLEKTHPQLYKYCMDKLGLKEILQYIGVPYEWRELDEQMELFD